MRLRFSASMVMRARARAALFDAHSKPRMIGRLASAALGLAAAFLPLGPALAQDTGLLRMQQQLINERKLADDRELQLLRRQEDLRDSLQAQLDAAKRGGNAASARISTLTRQLAETTKEERRLVDQILERDPASKILFADLDAELAQLSVDVPPAFRSAITQFGRGQRLQAWPAIEAGAARGSAREKRIAARLRTIMFNFQDAGVTAQDVRSRWEAALKADPTNAVALSGLADAEQYLGHIDAGLSLLAKAASGNASPQQRYLIAWQRAALASRLQKPEVMIPLLRDELAAGRALNNRSTSAAGMKWAEAQILSMLAAYLQMTGKIDDALASYSEAAGLLVELNREAPTWRFVDDTLAGTLFAKATLEAQLSKVDQALTTYRGAIELLTRRIAAVPEDAAQSQTLLAQAYTNSCNLHLYRSEYSEALPLCLNALKAENRIPQSAARDATLASDTLFVSRLLNAAGRPTEARDLFKTGVALWRGLAVASKTPFSLAGYASAIHEEALFDTSVCWSEVAAAWKALGQEASLNQQQDQLYLQARLMSDRIPCGRAASPH